MSPQTAGNRGSLVVTESDRCWRVTSSSPIELNNRHVVANKTIELSKTSTGYSKTTGVANPRPEPSQFV
ncbi:hypothetical protein TNCV_2553971 [Trichonephila clavipes]|nr:hypothetical protein TNCV_2553971 [Trichonephila clavipes]